MTAPHSTSADGAEGRLKIYFLPNLLTAGNLFCGFVALTKIVEADFSSGAFFYQIKVGLGFILLACIFDLFDGRGQSRHVYTNGGADRVKVPLGEFDAVRFFRGSAGDDRSEVWLAKELGYLPVKVLVTEKEGTRYEQVATKITTP